MSKVPSYYEIALTQRQVVIAFVILLVCLVAAFFSGVWMGSGAHGPRAAMQVAEEDGSRLGTQGPAGDAGPAAGEEPIGAAGEDAGEETGEDAGAEPGNMRFFTEADSGADSGTDSDPPTSRPTAQPSAQPSTQPGAATDEPPGPVHDDPNDPRRRNDLPTPVRPAPQAPELVDPRATEPPDAGGPVIQVFSSHDQAQAQQVLDRLLVADLDAYLSPAEVSGVIHYRVRLGPFRDRDQAEAVAAQLRRDFKLETWITR